MQNENFSLLNSMYESLDSCAGKLYSHLTENGFACGRGWYNFHTTEREGKEENEYYPIPVLSVNGIGDIALDFDRCFFEKTMTRAQTQKIPYSAIAKHYPFKLYGCAHAEMLYPVAGAKGLDDLAWKIAGSEEKNFHLQIQLPPESDFQQFRTLFALLQAENDADAQCSLF